MLDEPGNHLDFAGIAWLEGYLSALRGAVLLISHNRYLLDRVVGGILHLEDGTVNYIRRQLLHVPCDRSCGPSLRNAPTTSPNQKRLAQLEESREAVRGVSRGARPTPAGASACVLASRSSNARRKLAIEKPDAEASKIRMNFTARPAGRHRPAGARHTASRLANDASSTTRTSRSSAVNASRLLGPNGCGKTTLLRDDRRGRRMGSQHAIRVGPSLQRGLLCAGTGGA